MALIITEKQQQQKKQSELILTGEGTERRMGTHGFLEAKRWSLTRNKKHRSITKEYKSKKTQFIFLCRGLWDGLPDLR